MTSVDILQGMDHALFSPSWKGLGLGHIFVQQREGLGWVLPMMQT